MNNLNTRLPSTTIMLSAMVVLMVPCSTAGQSGNRNQAPPVAGSPKPGDELRPAGIRERQFRMMEMEREMAQPPRSAEDSKIAEAQIAQDYKQLQLINNKMMSDAIPAAAPDYARIAQALSEIKKRALRLKDNLGIAHLDIGDLRNGKHRPALNAADIKAHLFSLDNYIMSFVENSIFKNPDVVNVEEATKARRDLELIILNSQHIGKDAEQLNKSSKKAP